MNVESIRRQTFWTATYFYYYQFLLTASGFIPIGSGSGTTIRYNTHNNTQHSKQNTAHKITETIKYAYYIQ